VLYSLLAEQEKDENGTPDFDFLVEGELLRVPLDEFLKTKGLTEETIVDVEYFEPTPQPETGDTCEHDDWVSSVASWGGGEPGLMVTGSYDGIARVWKADASLKCTLGGGHSQAIKAVACVTGSIGQGVVTASKDHTLRLWTVPENGDAAVLGVCRGHEGSVDAVAADPSRDRFCSASWDGTIKLWEAAAPAAAATGATKVGSKKRKGASTAEIAAVATLDEHTDAVTAVSWPDSGVLYSGGWDHTLREWDVPTALCTRVLNHKTMIHAVDFSTQSSRLASAHGDKAICLWDPRRDAPGPVTKLLGHTEWVASVAWAPASDILLASASFDNRTLLWDVRSPKTHIHELCTHEDKSLCVGWNSSRMVMSGGADCKLRTAVMGSST